MSGWRAWAYPLPGDGLTALRDISLTLPENIEPEMDWQILPLFVVAVADWTAALYLRLAVDGCPRPDEDEFEAWELERLRPQIEGMLEPLEVLVRQDERAECESLLAENCPSPAVWFALALVAFASDEAHHAFGAAYTKFTSMPHAVVRPLGDGSSMSSPDLHRLPTR